MNDQRTKRIIKALIAAGVFITALIIALALLLAFAFERAARSIEQTNQRLNQIQAEKVNTTLPEIDYAKIAQHITEEVAKQVASIPKPKDGENGSNGNNGVDGKSIKGEDGKTPECYFQVGQCQGPNGLPGLTPRQIQFDGNGHWRLEGDDEWLPLFKVLPDGDKDNE